MFSPVTRLLLSLGRGRGETGLGWSFTEHGQYPFLKQPRRHSMVSHTGIPSWAVTGMMRRNLVAQRHRDTWENGASWPVCPGTSLLTHSSMRVLLPSVCAAEGEGGQLQGQNVTECRAPAVIPHTNLNRPPHNFHTEMNFSKNISGKII